MKSNNKIIIYDDSCPLCSAYTKAFVTAGMIQEENRKNFTTIDPHLLNLVDTKRCNNEIPVIDADTTQVWYGIDGLVEILQGKIPFIKKVARIRFLHWLLEKLYKFISYNRRVIVAAKAKPGNFDCTPDFNVAYRLLFLFIFMLFNTLMLVPVHTSILGKSFISVSLWHLQAAHFILVIANILIACFLDRKTAFEYLGQVNMLALTSILLLIPLIIANDQHFSNRIINDAYLALLTLFVFKEYNRRMDFAGIRRHYPIIYILNVVELVAFIIYLAI